MDLSIVIPLFNEEKVVSHLCRHLMKMTTCADVPIKEFIIVNDGSVDRTLELLKEAAQMDARIKILSFSRNFGHQIAVTAGLDISTGEATVVMDGDLQDPPEIIDRLVEKWKEGFDIVYAIRKTRQDKFIKRATAAIFYRLMRRLTEINIPLDAGDFALMDKKVVAVFKAMPERLRFIRGLRAWIGFKATGIEYERHSRFAGETKYPFKKMFNLALIGMLGFSTIPLRMATYCGIIVASTSFLFALWIFCARLFFNKTLFVSGWPSLMISVFFMGGVQLFIMGILGEYIGMIFREVQARPLYIIREQIGFSSNPADR